MGPAVFGEREGDREGVRERGDEVLREGGWGEGGELTELGSESSELGADLGPLGLEVAGLGD